MTLKIIALVLLIFAVEDTMHAVYVRKTEFLPAQLEWERAYKVNDMHAMLEALDKEVAAVKRARDHLWFLHSDQEGCADAARPSLTCANVWQTIGEAQQ